MCAAKPADPLRAAALHAVNEEFAASLDVLGDAEGLDEDRVRASVLLQMDRADEALDVCNRIINSSSTKLKAIDYIRRGAALFALDEFEEGKASFEAALGKGIKGKTARVETQARSWVARCNAELDFEASGANESLEIVEPVLAAPKPASLGSTVISVEAGPSTTGSTATTSTAVDAGPSTDTDIASLPPAAAPVSQLVEDDGPEPALPVPYGYVGRRAFEWDESPTHITITVLAKQADAARSSVSVQDALARSATEEVSNKPLSTLPGACSQLEVRLWRPEEHGGELALTIPLRGRVQTGVQVQYRRMAVEVSMAKDTPGLRWGQLQQPTVLSDGAEEPAVGSSTGGGSEAREGVAMAAGGGGGELDEAGNNDGEEGREEVDGSLSSAVESASLAGGESEEAGNIRGGKAPRSYDDWERLAEEAEQEDKAAKPEGDEALMHLFRDIYARSDEATRRAMNKSYQKSNGLCLSTNWKDVAQKDFEEEKEKYSKG